MFTWVIVLFSNKLVQRSFRVKHINILEIVTQICPFVRSENSKGQTDQCPDMYCIVFPAVMMSDVMNLRVTVVTACNAIISTGLHNLIEFDFAICLSGFGEAGLQKTSTAAATIVVGLVWCHFNEVFFTNH